ncbi:MAG: Nif3-like dinuclear metal center hexameric protein [Chitinophagales bacterium]
MKIKDITQYLETIAPLAYQESYDNAGLIVGNPDADCEKALLCLDSIESVVDEAIELGCNLIIAHHPIVFGGLKKITGKNYVERTIIKVIKNDIAIYAAHTNLDNVRQGVNAKIAEKLGLMNCEILAPKKNMLKQISVLCPLAQADGFRQALFNAGAGYVGDYNSTSFNSLGVSTFENPELSQQTQQGEIKIEAIYASPIEGRILQAIHQSHPQVKPTYTIVALDNRYQQVGSGMIGELSEAINEKEFLKLLKNNMQTPCVRHTSLRRKKVKKVAVCGGAGSFLLSTAMARGADVFVTADYKYHEFFDAEGKIVIADIGHYESEQFTMELFQEFLQKKFSNFAAILSNTNTNPVKYFI